MGDGLLGIARLCMELGNSSGPDMNDETIYQGHVVGCTSTLVESTGSKSYPKFPRQVEKEGNGVARLQILVEGLS